MGATTLDRLRHAVSAHTVGSGMRSGRAAPATPPIDRILKGEWVETPDGPAFVRDEWFPLDHAHGAFPLGAPLQADRDALRHLLRSECSPDPARYAFFDIETTGLSGGTGTYIVLAGLGTFEHAAPDEPLAFRLRQYFLAGPQHEQAMLALLAGDLARKDAIVTYNGRAFDVPCVESRLTLARIPSPCRDLPHFDLLHAVRRLYGHRMPGCRLADAERRLLRIERPDDIPGSLIPALYRDYLIAGRASPLRGVFRHNAEDVLSLAGVLAAAADLLAHDDHDPDDAAAAARWWERAGDAGRAMKLYDSALPWLEGGEDWSWAAERHALLCKRAGDRERAAAIWWKLWAEGSFAAGLELAKHLEHYARDLLAAQQITGELLLCPGTDVPALRHRLDRIERRLQHAA